ncbi:hypothetical protein BEWA_018920 [Theileria equi strain WA]|uniref:Uncharacterized protein n=1 Tax=Theileria equi strain WA TaxID=1537102 RepID=L0ATS3_THEEQ|nr:hypothetical protein BEWA_018920 [Theileria equi strain WA]AFZ79047.1 hypothetical protein BEWA_018920 [Theileria equi strain WA]|eukprot:XP_004828713.1 hypothetical protein BEWA_018920 [Theileria equi strain WA]
MKLSDDKGFFSHHYDDTDSCLTTSKPLEITELETPYDKRRVPIAAVRYLAGSKSPNNRGIRHNCDQISDWSDARSVQSDVCPESSLEKTSRTLRGNTGLGEHYPSNKYDSADTNTRIFQENIRDTQNEAFNFDIRRHVQNYLSKNTNLRHPHISKTSPSSFLTPNREFGFKFNTQNLKVNDRNDSSFDSFHHTIGMGRPSVLDSLIIRKAPYLKNNHNLGYIHTNKSLIGEGFVNSKYSQGWNVTESDIKNNSNFIAHVGREKNTQNSYYLEHRHYTAFNTETAFDNSHRLHASVQTFEPAYMNPGNNNHHNLNFQATIQQTVESAIKNVLDTYMAHNKENDRPSSNYNLTSDSRSCSDFNILRDKSGDETCIFKPRDLVNHKITTINSHEEHTDADNDIFCYDDINLLKETGTINSENNGNITNHIGKMDSDPFQFDLKRLSTELERLKFTTKFGAADENFTNLDDTIDCSDTFKNSYINGKAVGVGNFLEYADCTRVNGLYRLMEPGDYTNRESFIGEGHEDSFSNRNSDSSSVRTEMKYHNSIFIQEIDHFKDSPSKSYDLTESPVLFGKNFKSSKAREHIDENLFIRSEDVYSSESVSNSELFAPYLNDCEGNADSTTPQSSTNSEVDNLEILRKVQDLELYIKKIESVLSKVSVNGKPEGISDADVHNTKNRSVDVTCDDGRGNIISSSELIEGYKAASIIKKLLHVQSMESLVPAFTAFVQNRLSTPKV